MKKEAWRIIQYISIKKCVHTVLLDVSQGENVYLYAEGTAASEWSKKTSSLYVTL